MYRRPDYVTAAGVFLCLFGAFAVLDGLVNLSGSDRSLGANAPDFAPFVGLTFSAITLVAGINVFQGHNWARWLYAVSVFTFLVYDFTYFWGALYTLVPALVIRFLIVILLFLPDANRYFRSNSRH